MAVNDPVERLWYCSGNAWQSILTDCMPAADPAGMDMYITVPNGKVVCKRDSSHNERFHSVSNKVFHGANVGMQLFHNKVWQCAECTVLASWLNPLHTAVL